MKYLVIDIGGSAIKYSLMNNEGDFIEKSKIPTPKNSLEEFLNCIEGIFKNYKDVKGIAISIPGKVDSKEGYVYTGGALEYNQNYNLAKVLSERCKVPVSVENDGKCAALAEAWKGSLADVKDSLVLVLGTGIGGGVIKDKKIHRGIDFIAGEFSLIISNTNTSKGDELDSFASQCGVFKGLFNPAAKLKNVPIEEMTGEKFFELANKNDQDILKILDEYCYKLVLNVHNLQHIYNPEKIAIGGGISAQNILFEYILKNLNYHNSNFLSLSTPKVVKCEFRNDSNLIGALYHFKRMYNQN